MGELFEFSRLCFFVRLFKVASVGAKNEKRASRAVKNILVDFTISEIVLRSLISPTVCPGRK